IQISIIVGGGNIFRGATAEEHGLERTVGDYIGMLATIMNALALQAAMEKGRVVICAGGSGNPYFTTDTAAALRALETNSEIILKGTKVDGVFDKDPHKFKDAKLLPQVSFENAIKDKQIGVLDNSALSLCMDHKIPILVFNLNKEDNIKKAVSGEKIGTLIS